MFLSVTQPKPVVRYQTTGTRVSLSLEFSDPNPVYTPLFCLPEIYDNPKFESELPSLPSNFSEYTLTTIKNKTETF